MGQRPGGLDHTPLMEAVHRLRPKPSPLAVGDAVTYAPLEGGGTWALAGRRGEVVEVGDRVRVRWEDGQALSYPEGALVKVDP